MPDVDIAERHGRRPYGTFDPGGTSNQHREDRGSKPVAEACPPVETRCNTATVTGTGREG